MRELRRPCRGGGGPAELRPLTATAVAAPAVAAIAFAGTIAGIRLHDPVPPAAPALALPAVLPVAPGTAPPVPLPDGGSLAVDGEGGAPLARLDADRARPIGSVAKVMTALLVLRDHPLAAGAPGPQLTMTAADVADYQATVAADGSSLAVTEGQRLDERDLLLALLLPSANNIADTLARWVGGDIPVFVGRMNATAASLGMANSHFADPSGFSPQTESSANDLVRLGRAALAEPALADLVSTRTAVISGGIELHNLDTLLASEPGWLGIKTGETPDAGGCLLFAARRDVGDGASATVVGAVLGQPHLADALSSAARSARAALAGYAGVPLRTAPVAVRGTLTTPWGASTPLRLGESGAAAVAVRRGAAIELASKTGPVTAPLPAGTRVGEVVASAGGTQLAAWPVLTEADLDGPSVWWRLLHG